jgi:hypothetical protein
MGEQGLEYSVENNPHLSRRDILKLLGIGTALGALEGCVPASHSQLEDKVSLRPPVVPGQKNIERKGAELHFVGTTGKYGSYDTHRFYNAVGGMDFAISDADIYPVASGLVTGVAYGEISGNFITVSHGAWKSIYGHLQQPLVSQGTIVTRRERIGIGGRTGTGGRGLLHLHLSIASTPQIANLMNLVWDLTPDNYAHFNPVDFAAFKGIDDGHGNLTLPYWYGEENDGHLDKLFQEHHKDTSDISRRAVAKFQWAEINEYIIANKWRDAHIPIDVPFLYQRIREDKHPFRSEEAQSILTAIKDFLSFPPLLTAPKRNPYLPELYKA